MSTFSIPIISFEQISDSKFIFSEEIRKSASKIKDAKLRSLEKLPHQRCTVITLLVISVLLGLFAIYALLDFTGTIGLNAFSSGGIAAGAIAASLTLLLAGVDLLFHFQNLKKKVQNSQRTGEHKLEAFEAADKFLMNSLDEIVPTLLKREENLVVEQEREGRIYFSKRITELRLKPYIPFFNLERNKTLSIQDFRRYKEELYDPVKIERHAVTLEELEERSQRKASEKKEDASQETRFLPARLAERSDEFLPETLFTYDSFLRSGEEDYQFNKAKINVLKNQRYFDELLTLSETKANQSAFTFIEDNLCAAQINSENVRGFFKLAQKHNLDRLKEACFYPLATYADLEEVDVLSPPSKMDMQRLMRSHGNWWKILDKIDYKKIKHLVSKGHMLIPRFVEDYAKKLINLRAVSFQLEPQNESIDSVKIKNFIVSASNTGIQIIDIQNCKIAKAMEFQKELGEFVRAETEQVIYVRKGLDKKKVSELIAEYQIETVREPEPPIESDDESD